MPAGALCRAAVPAGWAVGRSEDFHSENLLPEMRGEHDAQRLPSFAQPRQEWLAKTLSSFVGPFLLRSLLALRPRRAP